MTHEEIYNKCKEFAHLHRIMCDKLARIEKSKFGFEFADTDSDRIIDSVNYGTDGLPFEDYMKEMQHYHESFVENNGNLKANGIYFG